MDKRLLALTTFLIVLVQSIPLIGQTAYGWNLHNTDNPEEVGPCRFDLSNPQKIEILRHHDFKICAGAFAGKRYYAYTYISIPGASRPVAFGTYNFESGEFTKIADYSQMTTLFYDMTYDYKNGVMYALGINGDNSTLLKVDLNNGEAKKLLNLSKRYVSLAADLDGHLYLEDTYGYLCTVNPENGAEDEINGGDYFPQEDAQSMTFNHKTGKLYWILPTGREGTEFVEMDKSTGYVEKSIFLDHDVQIVGFDMPFSMIKDGAPAMVENFDVVADSKGLKKAVISFTIPKTTSVGQPLNEKVTAIVQRNNQEIKRFKDLEAGKKVEYTDEVDSDDLYSYRVYCENAEGAGEDVGKQVFVGIDVPGKVENIKLIKIDRNSCALSWEAPTKSVHGGFLPKELNYDVTRLPDEVSVAENLKDCSFEDKDIIKLNNYQYRITPKYNDRSGDPSYSSFLVMGNAILPPYYCDFKESDLPFWKIIDANKDGKTWHRAMNGAMVCPYSEKSGDDWLISEAIKLEKGNRYKITFTASCYDEYTTEKLGVFLGKEYSEKEMKLIRDFEIINEEGQKQTYTAYIAPMEESGEFHLAFWMHSDPDKFEVNFYDVELKIAGEGNFSGKVTANGKPIEGAIISIQGTDYKTTSDQMGAFEFKNVSEGKYIIEVEKEGYKLYSSDIEIVAEQITTLNVDLQLLQKVKIEGSVLYLQDKPLKDACVRLSTIWKPEETKYQAYTDEKGGFSLDAVYEGTYLVKVSRAGLQTKTVEINVSESNKAIDPIVMDYKIVAPRLLTIQPSEQGNILSWQKPTDTDSIAYFKGPGVARLGVFEYTPKSVIGTVFRKPMALYSVRWMTDSYKGPHKYLDLIVFALDENGEPTNKILYEKDSIQNVDETWMTFELDEPLILPDGALVAFRYNGYISLLADAGEPGGLAFKEHVYILNRNYETQPFEYLDQHDMKKNYLLTVNYGAIDQTGKAEDTIDFSTGYKLFRKDADKKDAQWLEIAQTTSDKRETIDKGWNSLPMGHYQYAVKAVYKDEKESDSTLSQVIGKDLTTKITFIVTTNAGDQHANPEIRLYSKSQDKFFEAENVKGKWVIQDLPKEQYSLVAHLDGFNPIFQKNLDFTKDNAYEYDLKFVETKIQAYNLKVKSNGTPFSRDIRWNEDHFIFDDFESYEPFTLNPKSDKCNWMYWDLDNKETAEIQDVEFPHSGERMSFIVFNPYRTEPPLARKTVNILPYSGEQFLAAFSCRNEAAKDYLFSPILNFDGDVFFGAKVKAFTEQYGKEVIRLGYTTIETPENESDIQWLTDSLEIGDKDWTDIHKQLPPNAKRAVLAHLSNDTFILMTDNLFVGEESPFADGSLIKPFNDRASYTLVLDGKTVADKLKNYKFTLNNLSPGEHEVQVITKYISGETKACRKAFYVDPNDTNTESIKPLQCKIYPNPATDFIKIDGNLKTWELLNMGGRRILTGSTCMADISTCPEGFYLIKVKTNEGVHTQKIMIKR